MKPCALITGGEGFIGANLAGHLTAGGYDVHVLSRPNPRRQWKLLDLLAVEARVHAVDLLDRQGVAAAVGSIAPRSVFHLAGRVDLERSSRVARMCVEENIMTTVNLLDALQGMAVDSVIYTSTTEVYGSGPTPFREGQPVDPPSPYSVSKVAGESFCRLWAQTFGMPVRILRIAAAYGPGQPLARLVPFVIGCALRGEPVRLRGGAHERDYVFVSDIAAGIMAAAQRPVPAGETINLGTSQAISLRELAETILATMGRGDLPVVVGEARPNEAASWSTDGGKARELLGWVPTVPLAEGLRRTIAWYRALVGPGGGR
jgi:nucleoside-diphosphate-sugar epimerase